MVKKILIKLVFFMLILSLINPIYASVSKGNPAYSVETVYAPNQPIIGWINVSLNSVNSDSKLKSNLGGEMSLISLLQQNQNSNFSYNCVPASCTNSYTASKEDTSKNINLKVMGTEVIGIKIISSGLVTEVSSFSIDFTANHKESSILPIVIDILDDEEIEWRNYRSSNNYDYKIYGCFKDKDTSNVLIGETPYCERINLSSTSPGIKIGAEVIGTGLAKFELSLSDEILTKTCEAQTETGGDITCVPEVSAITPGEYTLCIKAKDAKAKTYLMKKEEVNPCGYAESEENKYDFPIFLQQRRYSPLGLCPSTHANLCSDNEGNTFCLNETCPEAKDVLLNKTGCPLTHSNLCVPSIEPEKNICMNISCPEIPYNQILDSTPTKIILNNTEFKKITGESRDIESEIEEYISSEYQGNCSKGCIIPIKVYSGIEQVLTFSNLNMIYSAGGLTQLTNKVYSLEKDVPKISSGYNKLYITPANLKMPSVYGNKTLSISLDGTNIFSTSVLIQNIPTISYITPTLTAKSYPTTFRTKLASNGTITKYIWDFGDGTALYETTSNEAKHTYSALGNYTIQIKVQGDNTGTTTSNFPVQVVSSMVVVPDLLKNSLTNLEKIKKQLDNFSSFEKFSVNYSLDLPYLESLVKAINSSIERGMNESMYDKALGDLISYEIPFSILKTGEMDSAFYLTKEDIDMSLLIDYFQTEINASEEAYQEEIIAWNLENLDVEATKKEFLGDYNSGERIALSKLFRIKIDKKTDYAEEVYLIISPPEDLIFYQDYGEIEKGDYLFIPLNQVSNEIVFSTFGDLEITDIPIFISPKISELTVIEIYDDSEEIEIQQKNKQKMFLIYSSIVVILGGMAWFFIQNWYKKKYETHLFRDRNNLYNLINYIHDSKKAGVQEGEIVKALKKNSWTGEQITYALKKYRGKRVKTN